MAKRPLTTGDFGLKKGDPVPPGIAARLAREIPVNRVRMGIARIGGEGRAFSAKLLAERAVEEQRKNIDAAVAAAVARTSASVLPGKRPEKKEPDKDEGTKE